MIDIPTVMKYEKVSAREERTLALKQLPPLPPPHALMSTATQKNSSDLLREAGEAA